MKLNADVGAEDVCAPKPPNAGGCCAWDVAGAPKPPNEDVGASACVAGWPKAGAAAGVDVAAPKAEVLPPKEKLLPNAAAERGHGK